MLLKRFFILIILPLAIISCKTTPDPVDPDDNDNSSNNIEPYVVTEEVYNQTFDEIEELIERLNKIISDRDFDSWMSYLSESYIEYHSNRDFLKEVSEKPYIKQYGIVLEDLNDYFNEVIVLSRSNVSLNEITFDDENHITAWTIFNGQNVKLYQLERINNEWKKSIW